MEQVPRQPEQQVVGHDESEVAPAPPATDESWDERVIREGIEAAVTEGRPIDDRTARYIASQLHGGQSSALYVLASSGAVLPEVFTELDHDRVEQEADVRRWIACLTLYCASRVDVGPVRGWAEQAEADDRVELMRRISAVAVARPALYRSEPTPCRLKVSRSSQRRPPPRLRRPTPATHAAFESSDRHPSNLIQQLCQLYGNIAADSLGRMLVRQRVLAVESQT